MNRKDGNMSAILNRKIELWRNVISTEANALGQFPKKEQKISDKWAAVMPQTGSLLQGRADGTTLSRTTHKIVIRYTKDIKPSDWFMYDEQRYSILYISDPYINHERLEIFCEAVSTE